jgi:hypothetical protein
MTNIQKVFFLHLMFLCLFLGACVEGNADEEKNIRQQEFEKKKESYAEKYASLTSFQQVAAEVEPLLAYRKNNVANVMSEVRTTYLVNKIVKFEGSHPVESARLLLLLYQYSGADDSEGLSEILTGWFYLNPATVISALTGIEDRLMPEFRNDDFLHLLYHGSCDYPLSVTEVPGGFDYERESGKMRERLLKLKNEDNEEIIQYLLEKVF